MLHRIYDNDTHFKINHITKEIISDSPKTMLVHNDHQSERFTFEMPRYIEGHDMSLCNVARVHYNNIESSSKNTNEGTYEIDDLQVSPDDEDVVICSWLIKRNATKYVGILPFALQFKCVTEEGNIDYQFSTLINSKISVGETIDNGEEIIEQYADILEQWKQEIVDVDTKITTQAEIDEDGLVSFKNSAGVTLFTLDLSEFSGSTNVYGELVLSTEALEIKEGAKGTFTVKLATAPSTNQIVYLALSDNTKLSISPSTLTFTPTDYDVEQTVTVTALEDEDENDESITISLTSKKVNAKSLVISIKDNDVTFIPFSGKEIALNLDISTWSYVADNEDKQPRCTDIANNEVIIGIGNNSGLVKPLEQFTSGTSQLVGTKSMARSKIDNNTSGSYTFLFITNELVNQDNKSRYLNFISPISYPKWNTDFTDHHIWYMLGLMKYLNTAGETIDLTIPDTMSDVTESTITEKAWTYYYMACVLHNDGRVEYHVNGVPIHTTESIEDFESWVWDGYGWSSMAIGDSFASGGNIKNLLIINDAVTSKEIVDYYEYQVASENATF